MEYLKELEYEAIYVIREVAAQFENAAILFSGGKDSITIAHLARKAFFPASIPFPLVHVDTGHNFPEVMEFRDAFANELDARLVVGSVQEAIDSGDLMEQKGKYASRNMLQTPALLKTIERFGFDACIGGGRRDEEKSRAKERFFSVRNDFGQWDVKRQRPELFDMLNGKIHKGENIRAFPISNWTELDVWNYIKQEQLALPSLYYSHMRPTFERDGLIWPVSDFVRLVPGEIVRPRRVRFRTVGDMSCSAAMESGASNIDEILYEIENAQTSERGARIDDKWSEAAMELRKVEGYF
ncbi:MAG: sulfate adenylyltransferase subunit 2 [Ignavibacteriae bacterium]|nr:MAG: sulfate adenylyltransferase subunit 2 [Ignavibacteriota bacterium]